MGRRVYSNVNDRFRHSNLGRVTYQQLEAVGHSRPGPVDIAYTPPGLAEEIKNDHMKRLLKEVQKIKPLMDARTDKRRRPISVSKEAFKMYRQLKLRPPAKKVATKKKSKART